MLSVGSPVTYGWVEMSLDECVQGCNTDHPPTQLECTKRIRKLLCKEENPPIQEVVDFGVYLSSSDMANRALCFVKRGAASDPIPAVQHAALAVGCCAEAGQYREQFSREQCRGRPARGGLIVARRFFLFIVQAI